MKKRIWKRTAALCTAVMVAGTALTALPVFVSAEPEPAADDTLIAQWSLDFNGVPAATSDTVKDSTDTLGYIQKSFPNANSRATDGDTRWKHRISGEYGIYGKPKTDGVLKMFNEEYTLNQEFNTGSEGNVKIAEPMQQVNFPGAFTQGDKKVLTSQSGEFFELSFDFANSAGASELMELRAKIVKDANGATGGSLMYLFQYMGGKLYFPFLNGSKREGYDPTAPIGSTVYRERWYNLRYVFRTGDTAKQGDEANYVWIYVNGAKVYEGIYVPKERNDNGDTYNSIYGVSDLQFCHTPSGTGRQDPARIAYYDNIRAAAYTANPLERADASYSKVLDFNGAPATNGADKTATQTALRASLGYWSDVVCKTDEDTGANAGKGHRTAVADGVMGRPTGDHSLEQWREAAWGNPTQFVNVAENGLMPTVEQGDFYDLEFYMAWDGTNEAAIKGIQPFWTHSGGKDGKGSSMLITVDRNGMVQAFSHGTGVILDANKWYKFNMVFHSGVKSAQEVDDQNWYKIYVDDTLIKDKTPFVPTGRADAGDTTQFDTFLGFSGFWLQLSDVPGTNWNAEKGNEENQAATQNNPASEHVFFDDLRTTVSKTEPTYTPVTLTASGEGAEIANMYLGGSIDGYGDGRITASTQFSAGEGNSLDWKEPYSADRNNYAVITKADGSKLYAAIRNYNELFKEVKFAAHADGVYGEKGESTSDTWGAWNGGDLASAYKKYTIWKYETGVAGKAADDYSARLVTTNTPGSETLDEHTRADLQAPFAQMTFSEDNDDRGQLFKMNRAMPMTIEYSVLLEGDFQNSSMVLVPNKIDDARAPLIFLGDGRVITGPTYGGASEDHASKTVGFYRKGEWNRVSVTYYPKSNKVESYLNGVLVDTDNAFKQAVVDAGQKINRWKVDQTFNGDADNQKSGSFALDDIRIYSGARPATVPVSLKDTGSYKVYDQGGVIFAPEGSLSAIDGTGVASQELYTDSTFATPNHGSVADGNILIAKGTDGLTYRYYYMAPGAPAAAMAGAVTNAEGAVDFSQPGEKGKVKVALHFFKPLAQPLNDVQVFIAQYDSNENLVAVDSAKGAANPVFAQDIQSDYVYPVTLTNWEIDNFTVSDKATTAKLIVLESAATMTPLTLAKPLKK